MTTRFFRRYQKGFTLLELVVVLAITGLIFGGLWGLLGSSSGQLQAQSAAQQYRAVISATRRLLAAGIAQPPFDPAGYPVGSPASDLPVSYLTNSNVGLLSPNFAPFCAGSTTIYCDSFGNEIHITAENKDASNTKWRFMVYSKNGAVSDKLGAQISSLIGTEGGFVYNQPTDNCTTTATAATTSCGSYNSFAMPLATMGVTGAGTGTGNVATLSYTADSNEISAPWLARLYKPTTDLNTVHAPINFAVATGGNPENSLTMNSNSLIMGDTLAGIGATAKLTMNGGNLYMGPYSTSSPTINGGSIYMGGSGLGGNIFDLGGKVTGFDTAFLFHNMTITPSGFYEVNAGTSATITSSTIILDATIGTNGSINLKVPGADPAPGSLGSVVISGDPAKILLTVNGIGHAEVFQAGQFIYTSDMRLKANIRPIDSALEKVLALHGMHYNWKATGRDDIGVLAQDVQKVFPEAVAQVGGGRLGVDYAKLIAPLIEAVRGLKEENDALKKRIDVLEKQKSAPAAF